MKKELNRKGFTLAELLIVVAIIAVLIAIAIPVFNSQLEKSRDATDAANTRSAYAEVIVGVIDNSLTGTDYYTKIDGKGQVAGWSNEADNTLTIGDKDVTNVANAKSVHFSIKDGKIDAIELTTDEADADGRDLIAGTDNIYGTATGTGG